MTSTQPDVPDNTAVRTALWRALHTEVDKAPPVLDDTVGLRLADPPAGWRDRGDMHPRGTAGFRASIVARARFIEDLVLAEAAHGTRQYVILGAGLDTFAQRHPEAGEKVTVFEVDQPETQAWKRRRLEDLGYGVPDWLRLVPTNFETDDAWLRQLAAAGFDPARPAVIVSTGVSMYLSKEANAITLRQAAKLAPGSVFAMSFLLPAELLDPADRPGLEMSSKGAAASGTPFVSFFTPDEVTSLAVECGFRTAEHVSGMTLADRYFAGRSDGLRPSTGEDLLIART
ncbi:MAG: class I SAM-dependent methyltransferase [Streptosporangiales bacterium]|nr:class I SAM-dependent methyltransferase [Streptosporangiales bacterium]